MGFFGNQYPTFSVISDFPDSNYKISFEVFVFTNTNDYSLDRKTINGQRYTVLKVANKKILYVAGVTMDTYNKKQIDLAEQAEYVFSTFSQILKAEGLDFCNIVRSWNYIENIVETFFEGVKTYQNYQIFNDTRTSWYRQSDFDNGYPASTGIGVTNGGIVTESIAVSETKEVKIHPMKNSLQTIPWMLSLVSSFSSLI